MRPLSIRCTGLTSLRGLDLDLSACPPGLVAIVGANGAGKTTVLDLLGPIPLFTELSTKPGSLKDYCTGLATIDVSIEFDGARYDHRIEVDPAFSGGRGRTRAWLTRNGVPLGDGGTDGGVTAYEQAVAAVYPSRDVFYASAFSSQDRGGSFLSLTVPERKDLFSRLLGLGELQRIAEKATDKRKVCDARLGVLDLQNRDLLEAESRARETAVEFNAAVANLPALESQHATAVHLHQVAVTGRAVAGAALETHQKLRDRAAAELQTAERAERKAYEEVNTHDNALTVLDRILGAGANAKERAAQLADAQALVAVRRATLPGQEAAVRTAKAEHDRMLATYQDLAKTRTRVKLAIESATPETTLADLLARVSGLDLQRQRLAHLDASIGDKPRTARMDLDRARNEAESARMKADAANAATVQAHKKADLIVSVPCKGETLRPEILSSKDQASNVRDCGTCTLLTEARSAVATLPHLQELHKLAVGHVFATESYVVIARREEAQVQAEVETATRLRAEVAELEALDARVAGARAAVATTERDRLDYDTLTTRMAELSPAIVEADHAYVEAVDQRDATAARLLVEEDTCRRLLGADLDLAAVQRAEAELPLVVSALAGARQRLQAAREAKVAIVVPPEATEADQAYREAGATEARRKGAVEAAARDLREQHDLVARLRGRLDTLGDSADRRAKVLVERETISVERAGLVLLEQAFGRDGIQALEVDAAGPEVSTLCNELLDACFGPRFSLSLRTVTEAKAGRVQREVFDVMVRDSTSSGPARPFTSYSGGEQVVIDCVLRLSLAIFNARRRGRVFDSLFCDEMDGALSEDMAARFPAVLRRALALGGFSRIFLISHRQSVWQQADALIEVANGTATLTVL